jgi:nucleoside-diphosphate-sugar epimerase
VFGLWYPAQVRIAVTGATGSVGVRVVQALAARPEVDEVVGIARRRPFLDLVGVTWREADVAADDLVPVFRGCDAVVHLAWLLQPSRDRDRLERVNVGGSDRVFAAAAAAGVGAVVHASSVGAYSPGPKDEAVDESWPTGGLPSSTYSRQKAAVERLLDRFERDQPGVRVVRLRPGLVLQREAATELRRLFLGPFVPGVLVRRRLIAVVPRLPGLRFQVVHATDVAEAFCAAVLGDASGAFNVAAEPVLDAAGMARAVGAHAVPLPRLPVRSAVDAGFRLRLHPAEPAWLDLLLSVPVMDTSRARRELGWTPSRSAEQVLVEVLDGIRDGAGFGTPPLQGATGVADRVHELRTGVGARERLEG